jgi:hypothetical protein
LLASLAAQTLPPQAVAVVCRRAADASPDPAPVLVHHAPTRVGPQAWNEGAALLAQRGAPDFWLFLDADDELEPDALERMAAVFRNRPDVGAVSPWTERTGLGGGLDARPMPSFDDQLVGNDVAPASGFRASAIPMPPFPPGLPREHDVWALANQVIAGGWTAVTLPALLARRRIPAADPNWLRDTALRAIRAETLAPLERADTRLALRVIDSYVPLKPSPPEDPADRKPIRRFILRGLEAVLMRPGQVLRRALGLRPAPARKSASS